METNTDKPAILSSNLFPVVGIGASAGGLAAFKQLLQAIPENSGMAYVLVQHLDPNHQSLLPEILQKVTSIPVLEISDDIKVQPNHIYVIPSNKMMVATDGILQLSPRTTKKTERNLPIDLFFTSLAEVHQSRSIGVVLSGTSSDGTLGLKAIKDHGGITFAQDEGSAEYDGMPGNAAHAGVVDFVLSPEAIPQKLLEIIAGLALGDTNLENVPPSGENIFRQILSLLRIRKGVDFTYYKQTTIRRRILRRMVLNQTADPLIYLTLLKENGAEQDQLFQDLLIPVTSFFRDKHTFEMMCEHVFPAIVKNKTAAEVCRIWVAGCSTGQEVYSIAVCFKEFLGDHHEKLQIFGTDLSEPAIAKARSGIYEKGELEGVSPQRLERYFTKNGGGYQVNKQVRDMCVFAHHNFLKDPPFGKMDFISCRNVLIYMEPHLQKKALTTFHYALNPKGFLLLGKSETTGSTAGLFTAVEKADKLFMRRDVPGRFIQVASQRSEQMLNRNPDTGKDETIRTDFQKMADEILLRQYTPAGVVVNETMDIVHFRGSTAPYLEQSPGKPTHNLLLLAKHGLAFELRNILHKAKTEKTAVLKQNIPVEVNGQLHKIALEAIPLPAALDPCWLILFHEDPLYGSIAAHTGTTQQGKKNSGKTKKDNNELRIQLLEQELAQARDDMRSITQDQEAFNEELQSANEELLSGSEELQSLNEELETSKEELQSTNEELTVLNHELVGMNEQVMVARNYAESIVDTIAQPLLVLDKNLRVKSANGAFYKTFKINQQQTENVLIYDLEGRQWNIPRLRELLEEILPNKTVINDYEITHHFTSIGERVFLLNALEIFREKQEEKLILLSIEDITDRSKAEAIIATSAGRFRTLVKELPAAVYACDLEGHITFYNDAAVKLWGRNPEKGIDKYDGFYKMFDYDGAPLSFDKSPVAVTLNKGHNASGKEIIIERRDGSRSFIKENTQPELSLSGTVTGVINMMTDVTEEVTARKKIEESNKRYYTTLMQSPFAFCMMKGKDMVIIMANDLMKEFWGKGKEVEGKTLLQVLPEVAGQPFPALIDSVYTTGKTVNANEILARLEYHGFIEDRYFNITYQPYVENEAIAGVITIAHEVTAQVIARKKMEAQALMVHDLLSTAPAFICTLTGPDHIYELVNERYQQLFGKRQIQGKPIMKALPELEGQGFDTLLDKVYNTGETYVGIDIPITLARDEGLAPRVNYFNFSYQPMYDENKNIFSILVFGYEVTEQVMAKNKILEYKNKYEIELEEKVKQRTAELSELNELLLQKNVELGKMNKELEAFTYVSSHDLQEPLRKIQTFAGILLQKENQNLSDKGKDYFKRMREAAARMQQLILDLLTFSRINSDDREFEKTDLAIVIDKIKSSFSEQILEKNATIEITGICELNIIAFQFDQLFQNLISNALKFSRHGIAPHITIHSKIAPGSQLENKKLSPQKMYCHISFADNGIGFDAQYKDQIFEMFQRLHGREEYGGTGIGLTIVKKIVENHHGIITATGEPGKGARFDMYFPA
ncbi:MAG: CheR family methyltransferase [Bacteroidota bacterium]